MQDTTNPENKIIYILSGLGADERVFKNLNLSPYQLHFINGSNL